MTDRRKRERQRQRRGGGRKECAEIGEGEVLFKLGSKFQIHFHFRHHRSACFVYFLSTTCFTFSSPGAFGIGYASSRVPPYPAGTSATSRSDNNVVCWVQHARTHVAGAWTITIDQYSTHVSLRANVTATVQQRSSRRTEGCCTAHCCHCGCTLPKLPFHALQSTRDGVCARARMYAEHG